MERIDDRYLKNGFTIQKTDNLNELEVETDGRADTSRPDAVQSATMVAYFQHLEEQLIHHIREADAVLGCVAWLTSTPILDALAKKTVSIVVQKEDFLRPDVDAKDATWRQYLRSKYDALHSVEMRCHLPGMAGDLSVCGDPTADPVRCVGNHNSDKRAAPRSHHKFVVFGKMKRIVNHVPASSRPGYSYESAEITPYGVWTGSFNFTKNAGRSFENAIYTEDPVIVKAYIDEYSHIFALSEQLDWESDWCAPEWRVGT